MIDSIILVSQAVVWVILAGWAVIFTLASLNDAKKKMVQQKSVEESKERMVREFEKALKEFEHQVDDLQRKLNESKDRHS